MSYLRMSPLKLPPRRHLVKKIINKYFFKYDRERAQDLFNTVIVLSLNFVDWLLYAVFSKLLLYLFFKDLCFFNLCFKMKLKLWSKGWKSLSTNLPCSLPHRGPYTIIHSEKGFQEAVWKYIPWCLQKRLQASAGRPTI